MKFKNVFLLVFGLVVSTLGLTSCNKDDGDTFVDYVHTDTAVRLRLDYKDANGKNRDFFQDGISEVELVTAIDGDTAHFRMVDNSDSSLIKSRFYGIDTPESTGQVENWGATASNFTKTKLKEAKTIVVTSTSLNEYKAPSADSTGTRYLSMIWVSDYEDAVYTDLVLLNLWIVQEGLSYVKNVNEFPEFSEVFYAAEAQARNLKMNLHSGEKEEGFNDGDYITTSLLDLKNAIVETLKDRKSILNFIHQNRDINNGFIYNPQIDLLPILGLGNNDLFKELLDSTRNNEEEILSYDLNLYNKEKAVLGGINNEFIYSPKEDNLVSADTSILSLISSISYDGISLVVVFHLFVFCL